jgi:protein SCO1/2
MRPRFHLGLMLVLALAAGAAIFGYQRFTGGEAGTLQIGGPFELVDGAGRTVTDRDFRGRWMLVYFGYTNCPDACPTALGDMAAALDRLGEARSRVVPIFITVDPEHDTPEVMKSYTAAFSPDLVGLTGTTDQIHQARRGYRVYAGRHPGTDGGYTVDHSSIIYLMDPKGRFVTNFTQQNGPDEIAQRLKELIS